MNKKIVEESNVESQKGYWVLGAGCWVEKA